MAVNRQIMSQLESMAASSYETALLITLAFASTPPGELSPNQTDALVELCYKMLTVQGKMKEILAAQLGQSDSQHAQVPACN